MVIRVAGAVFVLMSSSLLGFWMGHQFQERLSQLREIQKIFLSMVTDLECGQISMPESLERISGRTVWPFDEILRNVCAQIHRRGGKTLASIWKSQIARLQNKSALKPSDLEALAGMGDYLGCLDRKTQIQMIRLYLNDLEICVAEITDSIRARQKLCRMFGVAGGLLVVLLLL